MTFSNSKIEIVFLFKIHTMMNILRYLRCTKQNCFGNFNPAISILSLRIEYFRKSIMVPYLQYFDFRRRFFLQKHWKGWLIISVCGSHFVIFRSFDASEDVVHQIIGFNNPY